MAGSRTNVRIDGNGMERVWEGDLRDGVVQRRAVQGKKGNMFDKLEGREVVIGKSCRFTGSIHCLCVAKRQQCCLENCHFILGKLEKHLRLLKWQCAV